MFVAVAVDLHGSAELEISAAKLFSDFLHESGHLILFKTLKNTVFSFMISTLKTMILLMTLQEEVFIYIYIYIYIYMYIYIYIYIYI